MKPSHLILPVAALVVVGAWNVSALRFIASEENTIATLQDKILAGAAAGSAPLALAKVAIVTGPPATRSAADWREISSVMGESQVTGGRAQMQAAAEFQKNLAAMSRQEMIEALDEIKTLDLTDEQRQTLESTLIGPLIQQDPAYALERFGDRIHSDPDGLGWQLGGALSDWARKDLAAATAWFDRQIDAGNFDSKTLDGNSEMRVKFEAAIMEQLLATDPDAAARRLADVSENQRREVLQQLPFENLGPAEQSAYTALVRGLVPADEREGTFAYISGQLVGTGFDKVSAFLDSAQASPGERAAAVGQAAESHLEVLARKGAVTQKDIDSLRSWLTSQASAKVDQIVGKAIAEAAQGQGVFQFEQASQLVLHYQKVSGSDDGLISFLQSYAARSNLEQASHLAAMISNPVRRAQILESLK